MKFVKLTCSKCNGTMTVEDHGAYSRVSCPYCGSSAGMLVESDRVKVARLMAETEQLNRAFSYLEHRDYLSADWFRQKAQIVIICVFVVIILVLIGIFLGQASG